MKKKFSIWCIVSMALLLSACSKSEEAFVTTSYEVQQIAEYSGDDYIEVGHGDEMILKLQPSTGTIRWENSETGEYLDTRLTDSDLTDTTALSDVIANYYNGKESQKYNTTASMDSYTYGVSAEGLVYEKMENGVRFIYSLGSDDVTYKQFPAYISDERLNDLVLQYCDSKQVKAVKAQYRQMNSGAWARKTNKDNPLAGLAAPELYKIFYEVGKYSYEELEADCTEWDKLDELPSNQNIEIVMEYYLDGDDLMVRIPTENLVTNEEFPIASLDVLPYFLSSSSKDGYLFVPDGSGALIYLDNDKLSEYQYTSRYYGGDVLQDMEEYNASPTNMTLPVYGMKSDKFAVLGIIEEGAEIAQLNSYVSGYFSGIHYSRSSLRFLIREAQTLANYVGAITNYTMNKVSDDYYHDDILLRYCFLTGDDADYTGMAKAYQKRLIDQKRIACNEPEETAPLFLDFLGEIDKEKYFMGIPYKSSVPLTSFLDAQDMITEISNQGIDNIKVTYEGMLNGGINQRAVEKVKISDKLGGKSAWNKLKQQAEKLGVEIYPSVKLQTASTAKSLSKKERSYELNGSLAVLNRFDLVEHEPRKEDEYPTYIIAPKYIGQYVTKFNQNYRKLGTENLASSDFMTFMSPDYRNKGNISIKTAASEYDKALTELASGRKLVLSDPIVKAYGAVSYLTDIPSQNSGMKILDASVPFTQMVLDGCITYSSEYVNQNSESSQRAFMQALEGRSALNFRLMKEDTKMLTETTMDEVFFTEYSQWKEEIPEFYKQYEAFYQKVKGAYITDHRIVERNNNVRVVTYSNGVKLYLNYGEEAAEADGITIEPLSYTIQEGGRIEK